MRTIAIFVSGSGTNCENIIRHFAANRDIKVGLVVSNKPDAYALVRAKRLGVPCIVMPKAEFTHEDTLMPVMREYGIDFIILAGFLLMIPDFLVDAYRNRIINIHPSLLPKFGGRGMYGRNVHEAVKAAGEHQTGITIHHVSEVCDGGAIIAQYATQLSDADTVDDIERKIHELERLHYPAVIERVVSNHITQ